MLPVGGVGPANASIIIETGPPAVVPVQVVPETLVRATASITELSVSGNSSVRSPGRLEDEGCRNTIPNFSPSQKPHVMAAGVPSVSVS